MQHASTILIKLEPRSNELVMRHQNNKLPTIQLVKRRKLSENWKIVWKYLLSLYSAALVLYNLMNVPCVNHTSHPEIECAPTDS